MVSLLRVRRIRNPGFRGLIDPGPRDKQKLMSLAHTRKLVIIGDGACGKTSLLSVFTLGYFPTVSEPHIAECLHQLTRTSIMLVFLTGRTGHLADVEPTAAGLC